MSAPRPAGRRLWSPLRLAALFTTLFAVSIAVLIGTIYALTQHSLEREVDSVINAELEGLRDDYRAGGLARVVESLDLRTDSWGRSGAVYLLVDATGQRVSGNLLRWPADAAPDGRWIGFRIPAREGSHVVDHPVRALVTRIDASHQLLVGTDVTESQRFAASLREVTSWTALLVVLLAAAAGYVYVRRVGDHVHALAEACHRIIGGDLSRRLAVAGEDDEFDELATTVNGMLDRLHLQSLTLRTTFDCAAHDLRAPLHRARVRIEQALGAGGSDAEREGALQGTLEEIARVQATLSTLLTIARADAGVRPPTETTLALGPLVGEVAELYQPEAAAAGLALDCTTDPSAVIHADRQLLAQLLCNLLENALKFVPRGGAVHIRVAREAAGIVLEVADGGPGIPAADRERVLRPFERMNHHHDTAGSGLGLSLVAAIVRLYGGTLELQDAGPGLRVRCRFASA